MKDKEIIRKRNELSEEYRKVQDEWKAYDEQYPVLPGRVKPYDYDSRQRMFLDRLRNISDRIAALPKTTAEKIRLVLIWIFVLGLVSGIVWWFFLR